MDYQLKVVLAGFIVGSLVGLTGLGGGVVLLPLLILGLRVPAIVAVGTGAVFSALTKVGAAILHWRRGNVDWPLVGSMALGSVPAAFLGVGALAWLQRSYGQDVNSILTSFIGILLVVIPVLLVFQERVERLRGKRLRESLPGWMNRYHGGLITGLVGGLLVGMTSVGSGSVIMMLLLLFYQRSPAVLVGTDVTHAVLLTGVAGALHITIGTVDFGLVPWLLIGSIPGTVLGVKLTGVLPTVWLRRGLAGLLIVTGILMMW